MNSAKTSTLLPSFAAPRSSCTSVVMGNRAFIRMWAARRAAKPAANEHPAPVTVAPSADAAAPSAPPPAPPPLRGPVDEPLRTLFRSCEAHSETATK